MKRILLALVAAAVPHLALAQPPTVGSVHRFVDPIYHGTVLCDTLEQVRQIAEAEQPDQIYLAYLATPNALNEPTCAAVVTTGLVLDVEPLGLLARDGADFSAWAIEVQIGAGTGYMLYLEQVHIA